MIFQSTAHSAGARTAYSEMVTRGAVIFAFWSLGLTYIITHGNPPETPPSLAKAAPISLSVEAPSTWWFKIPELPKLAALSNLSAELILELKANTDVMGGEWQPSSNEKYAVQPVKKLVVNSKRVQALAQAPQSKPKPVELVQENTEPIIAAIHGQELVAVALVKGHAQALPVTKTVVALPETRGSVKEAARILISSQQYQAASLMLLESLPDIHSDLEHYGLLAVVLLGSKQYTEAVEMYASLIRLKPDNPQWWAGYALSLEKLGRVESVALAYAALQRVTDSNSQLGMLAQQKLEYYRSV